MYAYTSNALKDRKAVIIVVSSKDVAKLAGVSQATVSRVMNNPQSVKLVTRNKVLNAMEQTRYKPNLIARSLVTKSTRTIALITGGLTNPWFVEAADSIIKLADQRGYQTMVYFERQGAVKDFLYNAIGNNVDGILMSTIRLEDPLFEEIKRSGIPYMFYNRKPANGGNYVVLDNVLAGEMIIRHLLDIGHEKVSYISGKLDVSTFRDRMQGLNKVFKEENIQLDPDFANLIEPSVYEVERVAWKLMHLPDRPTAIICATDEIALICMDAIMSMGFKIPSDVSLASIDNASISAHHAIQLTCVGHQKFSMGDIATENLIEMIEKGESQQPRQIVLTPELVIRKTTSSIRKSNGV